MLKTWKIRSAFLFFIFCSSTSFAQQLDANLLNSTVLIRRPVEGDEVRGTGFLVFREVARNEAGNKQYQIILITNKHMLPAEHSKFQQLTIKIAVRNGGATETKDLPIDILGNDGKFLTTVAMNPNAQVDVAAVNMSQQILKEHAEFVLRAIETKVAVTTDQLLPIKDFREADIGIGTQIYMLGYPAGFSDPRNISPILRIGIVSTEPDKDYSFDEKVSKAYNLPSPIPGFIIDANVYPGSSGSMVVRRTNIVTGFSPGGKASVPYILGIVADSIPMHDAAINTNERMGLGVVFNSDTILETINLLPLGL